MTINDPMTPKNNLCIIPARGGSKRIPHKNIKDFLGKPIIAYSIEAALKSELFDEVMVSTDDKEIAEISIKHGAKVPFMRSGKTSDDYATTMDVIREVIHNYETQIGEKFDLICCIYPTAPLMHVNHIKAGLELLKERKYDAVLPVVPFSYPVWRGLKLNDEGKTKYVWPEYKNTRSQDLEKVYHDAGQWYWLRTPKVNESILSENTGSIVLNETEVQDIDSLNDWKIAEMKYRLLNET